MKLRLLLDRGDTLKGNAHVPLRSLREYNFREDIQHAYAQSEIVIVTDYREAYAIKNRSGTTGKIELSVLERMFGIYPLQFSSAAWLADQVVIRYGQVIPFPGASYAYILIAYSEEERKEAESFIERQSGGKP